jgi:general secretion pathway protein M
MNKEKYQRWVAVGLLVLVVLVCLGLLLPLIGKGFSYYDEKNNLLFRLQRQQKIAARKDSVAEILEATKVKFEEQAYFSHRDTEALASADLQNVIKTAVNDAGGQLTSTQGLPGKKENDFNRVAVRVRMSCTIENLRTVLHTFATARPVLVVDQIDITPVRGPGRRINVKQDASSQLNVSFQVVSFMRILPQ